MLLCYIATLNRAAEPGWYLHLLKQLKAYNVWTGKGIVGFQGGKTWWACVNFFAQIPWPGLKKWRDSNFFLPNNKTFPLLTRKEQAICLQKLQAVVITLSWLNFLEEYLMVKRTLTTLISFRCTGNVHA